MRVELANFSTVGPRPDWLGRVQQIVTAGLLVAVFAACGDQNDSATPTRTAFCSEMKRLGGERSEDYVGSGEHRADTEALLAVAPSGVKPDLQIYRDFLRIWSDRP
jgi:hypothetical protein